MKRVPFLLLGFVVAAACSDQDRLTEPPIDTEPIFEIWDAIHPTGNPDFFFLPPMVPHPNSHPEFDPLGFDATLSPVVEICELGDDGCYDSEGQPIGLVITSGQEFDAVGLSEADEHLAHRSVCP